MSGRLESKLARGGAAVVLLAALPFTAVAQQAFELVRERVLAVDMRIDTIQAPFSRPAVNGSAGLVWDTSVTSREPLAGLGGGVRVELRFPGGAGANWFIRVSAPGGAEVERILPAMVGPSQVVWTEEVTGPTARIELHRTASGQAPAVEIRRYARRVVPTFEQAIHGKPQLMPISDAPLRVRQFSKPVAKLRIIVPATGQVTCTGFMVGARLMLTNQHCIANDEEARSAFADFNFDSGGSSPVSVRIERLVSEPDVTLDYALVRLIADPPPGTGRLFFGRDTLKGVTSTPENPRPLFIIEHPSGLPKQASVADCGVEGAEIDGVSPLVKSDFGHTCDTLGGSSGSPVFDWDGRIVVGLHHFGFIAGTSKTVNQAVHVARILDDIAKKAPAEHAEVAAPPPPR